MDDLIRNALDEIFHDIDNRQPEDNTEQPVIQNQEPPNPSQENRNIINTNYDNIHLNPMNQMNINPMDIIPVNPINMNPIGLQIIIGGGMMGRMNILERSFQEQEVRDAPICSDFKQTLIEIPITLDNQTTYTCAICQDNPEVGDIMIELPCRDTPHYFHKGNNPEKCGGILSWFETNHLCPICRTEFPKHEEDEQDEGLIDEGEHGEGLIDEGLIDEDLIDEDENGEGEGEMIINLPLQDIVQAGGIQSMMNHIMRDIQEQREEDDIQQAILRSFEES
mgnify:CR=1 FL=1